MLTLLWMNVNTVSGVNIGVVQTGPNKNLADFKSARLETVNASNKTYP